MTSDNKGRIAGTGELNSIVRETRRASKGNVRIRIAQGFITVFGSEVETLRVFRWRLGYRMNEIADIGCGYSENLKTFYVTYRTALNNDFETE